MNTQQRILGCLAHPDDEILGPGGTLAQYGRAGARIEMVYTTRGEAGEISDPALATPETLGAVREAEMRCAAAHLGVADLHFLGYRDSGMAETAANERPDAYINAPDDEVVARLVAIIRQFKPQVVFTFEPFGGYGHPDHIAIHYHTHAAVPAAADPDYRPDLGPAWAVSRLFYPVVRSALFKEMKQRMEAHGLDTSFFDGLEERRAQSWPDDQFHLVVDVADTAQAKIDAFRCHKTQFGEDSLFQRLPEAEMKALYQQEHFALAWPEPEKGLMLAGLFDGLKIG